MRVTVLTNPVPLFESYHQPLADAMAKGLQSDAVYQVLMRLGFEWAGDLQNGPAAGELQGILVTLWDNAVLMGLSGQTMIDEFQTAATTRVLRPFYDNKIFSSRGNPVMQNRNPYSGTVTMADLPKTKEEQTNMHFLFSGLLIAIVGAVAFMFNYAGKK